MAGRGTAAEELRVESRGGLLTAEAEDVNVQELLEAISAQTGLALSLPGPLSKRVTVNIQGVELPAAIDRVLHGMSYALQYAPSAPAKNKLWVFSGGDTNVETSTETRSGRASYGPPPRHTASLDIGTAMRLEAVAALAEQETEPFAIALASAVADESPAVRYEAVYALGQIGGGISTRLLQHALQDPDTDVRVAAVDALGTIGDEQAASVLAGVLTDPDPALRETAVYALGEIPSERAADLLRQASGDPDEFVREAAADVLRELTDGD